MAKNRTKIPLFSEDKKTALEATAQAQFIAFAPFVFQASVQLRDSGILKFIESSGSDGAVIQTVATHTGMSLYAVRILLEAGLGIQLVHRKDGKYYLSKTGHIFLNHAQARINTDFMRDVCYDGAKDLRTSLEQNKPVGLRHLGGWNTIFEGLTHLPEPADSSWFAFDHFHAGRSFQEALPIVFEHKPESILDVGGNTGDWALACLQYDNDVTVGILDLPGEVERAKEEMASAGVSNRVSYHPNDMLTGEPLPKGYGVIWMSQFLNCFGENEILHILDKCYDAINDTTRIFINEPFWDRQLFEANAFSLQMTSLYFATIANGNSQIYDSQVYLSIIEKSKFRVVREIDHIGMSHTILELKRK